MKNRCSTRCKADKLSECSHVCPTLCCPAQLCARSSRGLCSQVLLRSHTQDLRHWGGLAISPMTVCPGESPGVRTPQAARPFGSMSPASPDAVTQTPGAESTRPSLTHTQPPRPPRQQMSVGLHAGPQFLETSTAYPALSLGTSSSQVRPVSFANSPSDSHKVFNYTGFSFSGCQTFISDAIPKE